MQPSGITSQKLRKFHGHSDNFKHYVKCLSFPLQWKWLWAIWTCSESQLFWYWSFSGTSPWFLAGWCLLFRGSAPQHPLSQCCVCSYTVLVLWWTSGICGWILTGLTVEMNKYLDYFEFNSSSDWPVVNFDWPGTHLWRNSFRYLLHLTEVLGSAIMKQL